MKSIHKILAMVLVVALVLAFVPGFEIPVTYAAEVSGDGSDVVSGGPEYDIIVTVPQVGQKIPVYESVVYPKTSGETSEIGFSIEWKVSENGVDYEYVYPYPTPSTVEDTVFESGKYYKATVFRDGRGAEPRQVAADCTCAINGVSYDLTSFIETMSRLDTAVTNETWVVYLTQDSSENTGATEFPHLTEVPEGYTGIYTKADLDAVRNNLAGNYILMNDIVFTDADFAEGGDFYNNGKGWMPIGPNYGEEFKGTFDGNGYEIKNLYIHADSRFAGLFGAVKDGVIQNLGMIDSEIVSSSVVGTENAEVFIGSIVGALNNGEIRNCYNTGNIQGSVVATASDSAGMLSVYVGGIVGTSFPGTISECYNTGSVSAVISSDAELGSTTALAYVGGIVGCLDSYSAASFCYNSGSISSFATCVSAVVYSGGITGYGRGTIDDCYNMDDVSSNATSNYSYGSYSEATLHSGGIAGTMTGSISRCYNMGDVEGTSYHSNANSMDANTPASTYVGGIVGTISGPISNCYNSGSVVAESSANDPSWNDVSTSVRAGGIVGSSSDLVEKCYNTGDVCATSSSANDDYYNDGDAVAYSYAGGIVGDLSQGKVKYCCNMGSVNVSSSSFQRVDLRGYAYAGGVVGTLWQGEISNCYNTGNVNAIATTTWIYADGRLISCAGGIVGPMHYDTLTNCYNTGSISATSAKNQSYEGGVIGYQGDPTLDESSEIRNNYYLNAETNGVGYGEDTCTKCSNEEMKIKSTFVGFDFNTVWTMDGDPDYLYPELRELSVSYEKELSHIIVSRLPNKTSYEIGDTLDLTGGKLTLIYNNGTTEEINLSDAAITGFDSSTTGDKTIVVKYQELSTTFTVSVVELVCIEVTTLPTKTVYMRGEAFDKNGMVVTATYSNNTSTSVSGYTVSCDLMVAGTRPVTVSYQGKTASFYVTVKGLGSIPHVPDGYIPIYTIEDLDNVRNNLTAKYILMNDLVFTEADFAEGGDFYNGGSGWRPIGDYENSFRGMFEGNGYIIKNLYINVSVSEGFYNYAALFGEINKGTVQNLGMVDSKITATVGPEVSIYAAGIVGVNYGNILNCYNTGSISVTAPGTGVGVQNAGYLWVGGIAGYNGDTIQNCYNSGDVRGISKEEVAYVGGIAGELRRGTISNCSNTGNVTSSNMAGGIVAEGSDGYIENCANHGNVTANAGYYGSSAGGIAAEILRPASVKNCYNTGAVCATGSDDYDGGDHAEAGGIIGSLFGTLSNCYNVGSVSAESSYFSPHAGGVVAGYSKYASISNCYYLDSAESGCGSSTDICVKCTDAEMKLQHTFVGFNFSDDWTMEGDASYPYPELVNVGVQTRVVLSIKVTTLPSKTEYVEGESLDLTGGKLTLTFDNETSFDINLSDAVVTGFNSSQLGEQILTVTYEGKTCTFTVTVKAAYILGDVDGNGIVDSDDAVYLLGYTLFAEYYPISQPCDFDGNGQVNSDDAVYLLGYTLFPDYYPLFK